VAEQPTRTQTEFESHEVQSCFNAGWEDEPAWQLVCDCQWEAWDQPSEEKARRAHALHRLTNLSAQLPGGYR
jgi:hypothetical protein